ncbi:shikimate kinase [Enterovirga aerilata]|uniref:Shikimate kinase n=1 Tax=Enterovirga aerilata TaxID=2730920 RepID=A0A849I4W8_9HYPH|nr:shikimate kinase [Enterovirga sp. DB1703]NNM71375.1 shikimate kinase [Enterovirga sp. DB1703]
MDRHIPGGQEAAGDDRPRSSGRDAPARDLRERLRDRAIVLVGLMGAGKTTVGRRLATRLDLPFRDADVEIETAAGMPISDIFAIYGEPAFRDGERRVIARLLDEGPLVLATGGGAYMNAETRAKIAARGISVWLKADHETLMRRVRRRSHRPLLANPDPEGTMRRLIAERYPVYAEADVAVESCDMPHDRVVAEVVKALESWFEAHEVEA